MSIQHKGIAFVQRLVRKLHQIRDRLTTRLAYMKETCGQFRHRTTICINIAKARVDTTLEITNATLRETIHKICRFVSLCLTMLHWCISQQIIQFIRLVGSHTIFILRTFCTNPKVNIPYQTLVTLGIFSCLKDNVRVAFKELSIVLLGPHFDAKIGIARFFVSLVHNTPNFNTNRLSSTFPIHFQFCCGFSSCLISITTNSSKV
mmetsp:Transcript_29779/g.43903  ORF Transcript_29779/g.43903 Transcript_29779/m.43903 type:complete len:205 (-) Transcript_29779:85-699(-)